MSVSPCVVVCVISIPRPYPDGGPGWHPAGRYADDSDVASTTIALDHAIVSDQVELRTRLDALAAFAHELASPDFYAGRWHDSEVRQTPDGEVRTMPWFELSERANAFTRAAAGNGWVQPFDWMAWVETDEAKALRDDRDALANATPEQLQQLLTAIIRSERFNDGSLEWAFQSGLMAAIARRARTLSRALGATPNA